MYMYTPWYSNVAVGNPLHMEDSGGILIAVKVIYDHFVEVVRPHLPTTCWAMTCRLTCCRFMKNYSLLASKQCVIFNLFFFLERAKVGHFEHQFLALVILFLGGTNADT